MGVQFQNNTTTLLFETNYIRQFANIEVIALLILRSSLEMVYFLLFLCFFVCFFNLFWKRNMNQVDLWPKTKFRISILNSEYQLNVVMMVIFHLDVW